MAIYQVGSVVSLRPLRVERLIEEQAAEEFRNFEHHTNPFRDQQDVAAVRLQVNIHPIAEDRMREKTRAALQKALAAGMERLVRVFEAEMAVRISVTEPQ